MKENGHSSPKVSADPEKEEKKTSGDDEEDIGPMVSILEVVCITSNSNSMFGLVELRMLRYEV